MPENLGQKGLTKVVKICVKITPDFVSIGLLEVKKGDYVVKQRQSGVKAMYQHGAGGCTPALAGLDRLFPVSGKARAQRPE
jgi:hypothetical protein